MKPLSRACNHERRIRVYVCILRTLDVFSCQIRTFINIKVYIWPLRQHFFNNVISRMSLFPSSCFEIVEWDCKINKNLLCIWCSFLIKIQPNQITTFIEFVWPLFLAFRLFNWRFYEKLSKTGTKNTKDN